MDNVRYTAKRLAEIVGATPKQVEALLGRKDGLAPAAAGPVDLAPRVVTELRAALRGSTGDALARVLAAPEAEVEAALAALAARGQVERRGTRWFVT